MTARGGAGVESKAKGGGVHRHGGAAGRTRSGNRYQREYAHRGWGDTNNLVGGVAVRKEWGQW